MSLPLFYAIYCLEAGIFFVVVPWTTIWTLNPLLHSNITVGMWADNPFLRGSVTGIGVIHLIIGARQLFDVIEARRDSAGRGR